MCNFQSVWSIRFVAAVLVCEKAEERIGSRNFYSRFPTLFISPLTVEIAPLANVDGFTNYSNL